MRSLSRRLQPQPMTGPRTSCHHAGPQESLEIKHQIEPVRAQVRQQAQVPEEATTPLEGNRSGQAGMSRQQALKLAVDDPVDLGTWPGGLKDTRERKGLHHIAEGTRLDDGNPAD